MTEKAVRNWNQVTKSCKIFLPVNLSYTSLATLLQRSKSKQDACVLHAFYSSQVVTNYTKPPLIWNPFCQLGLYYCWFWSKAVILRVSKVGSKQCYLCICFATCYFKMLEHTTGRIRKKVECCWVTRSLHSPGIPLLAFPWGATPMGLCRVNPCRTLSTALSPWGSHTDQYTAAVTPLNTTSITAFRHQILFHNKVKRTIKMVPHLSKI